MLGAKNAELYRKHLAGAEVILPEEAPERRHVYHIYAIRHRRRDALIEHLKERGVGVNIHYPVPVHLQKAYQHLALGKGSYPVTERVTSEILSLPMFPELTEEQIAYTADAVKAFK